MPQVIANFVELSSYEGHPSCLNSFSWMNYKRFCGDEPDIEINVHSMFKKFDQGLIKYVLQN